MNVLPLPHFPKRSPTLRSGIHPPIKYSSSGMDRRSDTVSNRNRRGFELITSSFSPAITVRMFMLRPPRLREATNHGHHDQQ